MELTSRIPGFCKEKMPDILAQWVMYMLKEEFDTEVQREIEQTGKLTKQTWKITAHNISKKIRESRQMTNFLTNIQSLIDRDGMSHQLAAANASGSNLQLSDPRQIEHSFHQAFSDCTVSIKIDALNMLLHSQLLHVMINSNHEVSSRSWKKINPHLQQCLHDDDIKIFTLSFKIHVKLVNSPLPQVIKEGFSNLLAALAHMYSQNNLNVPSNDMAPDEPNLMKIIKIIHCILFTVNKTSHHFLKMSDKLSENIMENFFELLTFKTQENVLGPYAIVSAIDPHATWFKHALHGNLMQGHIFQLLLTMPIMNKLVGKIINFDGATDNKYQFAQFIHSAEMFRTIMKYHQGRSLFPVQTSIEDKPITIEHIYIHIIQYLSDENKIGAAVLSDVLVDGITVCLDARILKNDSPLMSAILKPLPSALQNHSIRALEAIVGTEFGIHSLIQAQDAICVLEYAAMILNEEINCSPNEKIIILNICGKILANHEGFIRNMETRFIPEILRSFQQEIYSEEDVTVKLKGALFQCISNIGSTPLGVMRLSQVPGLLEELTLMWSSSGKIEHLLCLSLASFLEDDQQLPDLPTLFMPRTKERNNHRNSELFKFLKATRDEPHDSTWHAQLRTTFAGMRQETIKASVILDLVEHLSRDATIVPTKQPKSKLADEEISQELAMAEWVVRYGECNNLLQGSQKNVDDLLELLNAYGSGQDWFLATAFLLCGGLVEKCEAFLLTISSLPAGAILWPDKKSGKYHEQLFKFGHQLETIVEEEFPVASKALRMSGISWWYVTQMWISHSFLPAHKWNQVCQWVLFSLITPTDQNLYYCLALLKHMEPSILTAVENGTIVQLIRKPIDGFRVTEYISYIDKLSKRYGKVFI